MWKKKRPFPEEAAGEQSGIEMKDEMNKKKFIAESDEETTENGGENENMQGKNIYTDEIKSLMEYYGTSNPTRAVRLFLADTEYLRKRRGERGNMKKTDDGKMSGEIIKKRIDFEKSLIQKKDPDFNVYEAYYSDPQFKKDVDESGCVAFAYMNLIERNALMAGKKLRKQPPQRSYIEVGAESGTTSGTVRTSPADLPDDEFEKYLKNIMNQ